MQTKLVVLKVTKISKRKETLVVCIPCEHRSIGDARKKKAFKMLVHVTCMNVTTTLVWHN